MIPAKLQETLDIAVNEVAECLAAEQILNGFTRHHEDLAGLEPAIQRPWEYIEQAVSWKLALAVNRLLQPAKVDRASLLGIEREVATARESGFVLAFPEQYDRAIAALRVIREMPEAVSLRECRDGFMAHALVGGQRAGIPLDGVRTLLEHLEPIVEDLCIAISGTESILRNHYADWIEWSDSWWDRFFPHR